MTASFRRLVPAGGECGAREALAGWRDELLGDRQRPRGPRLALNMVASVDGRVAIGGRSAPLSGPPDRELFHELRAQADAVMVGAGTVRIERYGPIIRDADVRERRRAAGLREQPLAVIASRSLDLPADLPLLADPDSHIVVLGPGPPRSTARWRPSPSSVARTLPTVSPSCSRTTTSASSCAKADRR